MRKLNLAELRLVGGGTDSSTSGYPGDDPWSGGGGGDDPGGGGGGVFGDGVDPMGNPTGHPPAPPPPPPPPPPDRNWPIQGPLTPGQQLGVRG